MMTRLRKRHSPEQIVRMLRDTDASESAPVPHQIACRRRKNRRDNRELITQSP